MTKKLETLLNLPETDKPEPPLVKPDSDTQNIKAAIINLQEKISEFDKISSSLPRVDGLGKISDDELDNLADKAERAFDDLMDLGMNVEARFGGKMFEVAATMLKTAVEARASKHDKKLKIVELQLKKLALDQRAAKSEDSASATVEPKNVIMTDRNSLIEKLRKTDK